MAITNTLFFYVLYTLGNYCIWWAEDERNGKGTFTGYVFILIEHKETSSVEYLVFRPSWSVFAYVCDDAKKWR